MELASKTTLAQMMERDDFSKRFSDNSPISLLEFFYPLYQGYDSVAVKADIEIGGNDQLWNLMLGREIQKSYDLSPQIAMTFPLLVGTDGSKKMSQSLNNYISISDNAENIFGKIMSIPDEIMWDYFTMLTDLKISEIADLRKNVDKGKTNPFDYKKMLGKLIVSEIYDENSALAAESSFENITINKNLPENMPETNIEDEIDVHLPNFLTENELTKSNSEARRLIESGSVKIDDQKVELLDINSSDLIGKTLQVGKRKFLKINKK
jgi:tyrosyl-tRNA synthetase